MDLSFGLSWFDRGTKITISASQPHLMENARGCCHFSTHKVPLAVMAVIIMTACLLPAFGQEYQDLGVMVKTVAENLEAPWSVAWLPDGTMLFTERSGQLRVIQDGVLQKEPLMSLDVGSVEGGLLGVAVDPDYSENHYIYLYYTESWFLTSTNKIVRYYYSDGEIYEDGTVIDGIPGGPIHNGGRMKFGPDGKIYITTGDAGLSHLSQDMNSLGGKILRANPDGTIPHDNPFDGSAIYSLGHRNPQGLDWDTAGNLWVSEHGPSGERGRAHDEINLVVPGANYGWPDIVGDETREGLEAPVLHTGEQTWAPSGAAFYSSEIIPQWTDKYFIATLRGSHLHMIDFEGTRISSHQELFAGDFGRLRDVAVGPDGLLYLLTSNRDGRGDPRENDDRILVILPMESTGFEECAKNNTITDAYPRQCMQDGLIFVESTLGHLCGTTSEDNPVHVTTNMDSYDFGGTLLVEGCVNGRHSMVDITIADPSGRNIAMEFVPVGADGIFATKFVLDEERFPVNGTYSVIADIDNSHYSSKTFTVPEFGMVILALGAGLAGISLFQKRFAGGVGAFKR